MSADQAEKMTLPVVQQLQVCKQKDKQSSNLGGLIAKHLQAKSLQQSESLLSTHWLGGQ